MLILVDSGRTILDPSTWADGSNLIIFVFFNLSGPMGSREQAQNRPRGFLGTGLMGSFWPLGPFERLEVFVRL